jgi:steroid delta-isomerase-like uncharacterized protein
MPMTIDASLRAHREELVEALVDAVNLGDAAGAADLMPHPRFELIGVNRVYDGREAVEQYLRDRRTAFPDQRYELIALHHADDAVIAEFWLVGTHLGDLDGLPATGRAFRCRMATFFVFEGEQLVCERIYFDAGTIARQLA